MTIDAKTREAIILGAVASVGPTQNPDAEWNARVTERAVSLLMMLREHSAVSRAIDEIEACGKPFVATIIGGRKEPSSTRTVVDLHVDGKDEIEQIRTDRTDTAAGQALSARAASLKYHRVLVFKSMEQMAGSTDRKVRVLKHIEDLGVDKNFAHLLEGKPQVA